MAKKEVVEVTEQLTNIDFGGELDMDEIEAPTKVVLETKVPEKVYEEPKAAMPFKEAEKSGLISCLRNEIVTVRFVPQKCWATDNPKHIFAGNMAEGAKRTFTVPVYESNGSFVNVLTNDEKAFLEAIMGLEYNALSVHKAKDNFWENFRVELGKDDSYLNLSDPTSYIKYKVLLANKDMIADSIRTLQDYPKATYQYVLICEDDDVKQANKGLNATMRAYNLLGTIQEDKDTLRVVVSGIDGRPVNPNVKLDFLQVQCQKLIEMNPRLFIDHVSDKLLPTKVLIQKCVEAGLISKKGGYYYMRSDNSALCEHGQEPTLNSAARYLNSPIRQELKFSLEAKLKDK